MLDVGADLRADAEDLLQYALMGASYARNGLDLSRPRVGLLNVGTEDHKGRAEIKVAAELIARVAPAADFDFVGFVEGVDLPSDKVDVIVTDGFTGNVALKTGEGTARMIRELMGEAFRYSPLSRIAALLAYTSLRRLSKRIDPRRVNGGVFLGLNGTVVKSHGGADATGVAAAIKLAARLAAPGFNQRLAARIRRPNMPPRWPCRMDDAGEGANAMTRRAVAVGRRPLPARARRRERGVRGHARHLRRMDPQPLGHRAPPFRRRGRDHERHGRHRRPPRAGGRRPDARRPRRGRRGHLHPRPHLPVRRHDGPGGAGMPGGFAFDVQAVCAGFVYALANANALILSGQADRVAVIGAETFSRIMDWTDRGTCVLFGDGAGALILEAQEGDGTPADRGILATDLNSDGRFRDLLYVDGGVSSSGTAGVLKMQGKEVFRHAVEKLSETAETALRKAGLTADDVAWIVPHQANLRIITRTAQKMGVGMDRVVVTVQDHGNTSAASIPLALSVAVGDGRITKGDLLVAEAIGGGLAWGSVVLRW
jgi:3-oxoacyl-(acyl-carrier-protein) synthase III